MTASQLTGQIVEKLHLIMVAILDFDQAAVDIIKLNGTIGKNMTERTVYFSFFISVKRPAGDS